jgi:sRNA-binding protein
VTSVDAAVTARVIAMLIERFPQAFSLDERQKKPLKVGIFRDLMLALDGSVNEFALSTALAAYCGTLGYLKRCREGRKRVGLDGAWVGSVSAAEAKFARIARDRLEDAAALRRSRR